MGGYYYSLYPPIFYFFYLKLYGIYRIRMSGKEGLGEVGKQKYDILKQKGIKLANKVTFEVKNWKESPVKENKKALQTINYFERELQDCDNNNKLKIESIVSSFDAKIKELISKKESAIKKIEAETETYKNYLTSQLETTKKKYEESKVPVKPKSLLSAENNFQNFLEEWNTNFNFKCPVYICNDNNLSPEDQVIVKDTYPITQVKVESTPMPILKNGYWGTTDEQENEKLRLLAIEDDRKYRKEVEEKERERIEKQKQEEKFLKLLEQKRKEERWKQLQNEPEEEEELDELEQLERMVAHNKATFTKKDWDEVERMNEYQKKKYTFKEETKEEYLARLKRQKEKEAEAKRLEIEILTSKPEPPPIAPKPKKLKKTVPKRETTVGQGVATYQIPLTQKKYDSDDD